MRIDLRAYRTFQALIFGGWGVFLLAKIGDGRILLYINQRFMLLILAAALGFLLLGQVALAARPRMRDVSGDELTKVPSAWSLWILALPLLVGLLVPQRPLGSSAAALRGFSAGGLTAAGSGSGSPLSIPSAQRDVLDWLRAFQADSPRNLEGQQADLVGFVYRDPRLAPDHFIAARFSVTCCLADASALGVEVFWPGASGLVDSAWVRVKGRMTVRTQSGSQTPLLLADSVQVVPAPEQPYLFP